MAVLTYDQIMDYIKKLTDGRDDDETLTMIQDFADTANVLDGTVTDTEEIKAEYEAKLAELDKSWREKYKNAFFEGTSDTTPDTESVPDDTDVDEEPHTFEELFTVEDKEK